VHQDGDLGGGAPPASTEEPPCNPNTTASRPIETSHRAAGREKSWVIGFPLSARKIGQESVAGAVGDRSRPLRKLGAARAAPQFTYAVRSMELGTVLNASHTDGHDPEHDAISDGVVDDAECRDVGGTGDRHGVEEPDDLQRV